MMVSFEDPVLGDAADELEQLGYEFARDVLLYLQEVHSGTVNFRLLIHSTPTKVLRCSMLRPEVIS